MVSELQSTAVPALQDNVAESHVSTPLQALPSLQSASFVQPHALVLWTQPPEASTQLSTVQVMLSLQLIAVPAQLPAVHTSPEVQIKPSLQAVPFVFEGFEQTPVDGLQVPALWHWSGAGQTTGLAPVQVPLWHVSTRLQALPSLQLVPSGLFGLEQAPVLVLQVPAVWH